MGRNVSDLIIFWQLLYYWRRASSEDIFKACIYPRICISKNKACTEKCVSLLKADVSKRELFIERLRAYATPASYEAYYYL
jgi:hypothetical protein